jgi:hypothetical protein
MTNILSFSLVKSEYNITYDGDAFTIHRAAKGYSDMVFKPHKCGLHVYDPDNPRGCYSFMETVKNDVIGSISLGPSGNAQGGHKIFTLTTGNLDRIAHIRGCH